jgi:hypothetical protein
MPKRSEFPRFREAVRKGKEGQVWRSYFIDMRGIGPSDIPLGTDRDKALELWRKAMAGERIEPARKVAVRPGQIRAGRRRKLDPKPWDGRPPWAKSMYLGAEKRSASKGFASLLSIDEFLAVVDRAAGRCEVTGIEFARSESGRSPWAPSLDRIDAKRGYTADNVRLVCLLVNQALGEWGDGPLRTVAEAICGSGRLAQCGSSSATA